MVLADPTLPGASGFVMLNASVLVIKLVILICYAWIAASWTLLVLQCARPGWKRGVLALPVITLHLVVPLLLDPETEPLLITPIAGSFSLSAFKLLAFALDRGPLSQPGLSRLQFLGLLLLPIVPLGAMSAPLKTRLRPAAAAKAAADSSAADVSARASPSPSVASGANARLLVHESALGNAPKTLSELCWSYSRNMAVGLLVSWILLIPDLPVMVRHWFYTLSSAVFLTAVFDVMSAWASVALGIACAPSFDRPWLCDSFQDFWARRWNLVTTYMMRVLVYEPVVQCSLLPPYEDETPALHAPAGAVSTGTSGDSAGAGTKLDAPHPSDSGAGASQERSLSPSAGLPPVQPSASKDRRSRSLGQSGEAGVRRSGSESDDEGSGSEPGELAPDDVTSEPELSLSTAGRLDTAAPQRRAVKPRASGSEPLQSTSVIDLAGEDTGDAGEEVAPGGRGAGRGVAAAIGSDEEEDEQGCEGKAEEGMEEGNGADDDGEGRGAYECHNPSVDQQKTADEPAGPEEDSGDATEAREEEGEEEEAGRAVSGWPARSRSVASVGGLRRRRAASAARTPSASARQVAEAVHVASGKAARAAGGGGIMRPSPLRRFLGLQATFLFSGAWHILVFWFNTRVFSWRWCAFFAIQAPILMLERALRKASRAYGIRLPHSVQVVLTNFLLIAVARHLFFGPADTHGFAQRNLQVGQDVFWWLYGLAERLVIWQSEGLVVQQEMASRAAAAAGAMAGVCPVMPA